MMQGNEDQNELTIPIELIEEYLSDGYLSKFEDETLTITNMELDELDRLFMELSDGAKQDNITTVIAERLGTELAYELFKAYDNVAGEELSTRMLNDENGQWKNSLQPMFEDDERKLKLRPRRKSPAKATYRHLISESKHVNFIEIALPATGIRITLEPLRPRTFALLKMRIAREKIVLNRRIYGAKFDLNQAVADSYIVETIMGCVIESNLENWTKDTLVDIFDDRDMDYLCLNAILPYYPKGYNINYQCSNVLEEQLTDEEEEDIGSDEPPRELKKVACGHVDKMTINLSHVMWYNYNLIDKDRFAFSGLDRKVTYDDVMEFRNSEQLRSNVFGKSNWEIELQPCTTVSRLIENRRWLTSIESELTETFNNNVSEEMMIDRFTQVMAVEQLRNFIPYLKAFRTYTDETREELQSERDLSALTERDPAANILEYLNASDDIDFIIESIAKFLKDNQYAVPAYINRACSKCGKPHQEENKETRLIPLEAKRIFFTIMEQRLVKAAV